MKKRSFCIMFWMALFILTRAPLASAQEMFADLLSPAPPSWSSRGNFEDGASTRQQKFQISAPINRVPTDPALVSWKWSQLDLKENAEFENNIRVPDRFASSEIGVSYKHNESQSQFWGLTASMGHASDQGTDVLQSKSKAIYSATAFYSLSDDPSVRWLWLLNYSNNRSFLNEIPIPGFAYIYRPSADFMGVFGLPFAFIRSKWNEHWSSQFFFSIYTYKIEISRQLQKPFSIYASTERAVQSYYRDAREKENARVFFTEAKTLLGLRAPVSAVFSSELYAGISHHRSVIETEEDPGYTKVGTRLQNQSVLGAQISARF